ncbi:LysE/ArgO family amino acid transporter [Kineococcus gynurae]|uniref:LysE/ArgO family amino acid transporter n=1 Tax=Kineococcus gynurae TaxID=452979 RepID=A0ABV5LT14_9ACTN
MTVLLTVLAGLGLGLSLIVAIGAQNAFVLRQGLRGEHVGLVVAVCAATDVTLIFAGTAGVGVVLERAPVVVDVVRWAGAAFLAGYAVLAARRALHPGALRAGTEGARVPAARVLTAVLALSWLNPHVYLDTVLLLGSVAGSHGGDRWWFALGAALGSITWFTLLGVGARWLRPFFARPAAWRLLDAGVAVVMATLAVLLVLRPV